MINPLRKKKMPAVVLTLVKERWHKEVYENALAVDPNDDYTWDGLLVGFLLGCGVPLRQALDISLNAPGNGWLI